MTKCADAETIQTIATAGADAVTRWRASKQTSRMINYRHRMEQAKEADPKLWLLAIERDDRTDPVELEEQAA